MAFAATAASAGERWRYLESPQAGALEPANFMLGRDGGLWTASSDGVRRFGPDGAPSGPIPAFGFGGGLADGGAILQSSGGVADGARCHYLRVDASLRTRWSHRDACGAYTATPDGSAWLAAYDGALRRIGPDGAVAADATFTLSVVGLVAMSDGGAVVASSDAVGGGGARVARYGADGALLWTFVRDGTVIERIARGGDDSLAVAGYFRSNGGADSSLVFYRLGANGAVINEYRTTRADVEGLLLAGDGSASLVANQDGGSIPGRLLYRFDPDGRFLWRTQACGDNDGMGAPGLALVSGGDAVVACPDYDGANFVRFDANGARAATAVLPSWKAKMALRPDGNLQMLGSPGARPLYVRDLDGRPVAYTAPQAAEPLYVVDRHFDADGSSWLLSISARDAGEKRLYLTKVDASGASVWRRTFPAEAADVHLSVAGGQACVAMAPRLSSTWPGMPLPQMPGPVGIRCFVASDGAERWARSFPEDVGPHYFGALDDGTFVHLRSGADRDGVTHTFVRYDGNGQEIVNKTGRGLARSAAIGAAARSAVVEASVEPQAGVAQWRLVRYDAQGDAHELRAASAERVDVAEVTADAVLVFGLAVESGRTVRTALRSYAIDGRPMWVREFADRSYSARFVRDGAAIYLLRFVGSSPVDANATGRFARLDAQSGVPVWEQTLAPGLSWTWTAFGGAGNNAALARIDGGRLRVLRFDAHDGSMRGEDVVDCRYRCTPEFETQPLALDARGVARMAVQVSSTAGSSTGIISVDDASAQPAVRLDQPGLTGAWWTPYANGEGFVADWLPSSRTWFIPWFTFSRAGGDERGGQRWYTVAGTVAAGATQAQLPILETTGGTFDTGGGTSARQVGVATLRFTDCDNGNLRYAFDPATNDGATGTITLSRLSAATQDCVLADGTVQPRATPPAGGFDARMSGSWYEEATSGQGLQFAVQPGGVLFAPWFTFDPAGAADDPGRQRWYTLQGSLANATGGRVEVPIVETTGGAFDRVPANRMTIVGKATLTMRGCDRATLDYAFDAAASDLAGRTGTIDLIKAGGCMP